MSRTIPRVLAGCPVRGRETILPRHVDAILNQDAEAEIGLFHLVNGGDDDEIDKTITALWQSTGEGKTWVRQPINCSHEVFSIIVDPGGEREGELTYRDDNHYALSQLRNEWVESALFWGDDLTHYWLVDSDVLPDPSCLRLLLEADKDIVAAVVKNGPGHTWNFMTGRDPYGTPTRTFLDEKCAELNIPFRVPLVGACVLIKAEVLRKMGPAFGAHPRGEDFPFCAAASAHGYDLWVHPLARTTHVMGPTTEEEYR